MFYRIFFHCVSPRQYVLYLESLVKPQFSKKGKAFRSITPSVVAGCDDENTQSITESKQANEKQKEVETFTLNPYVPEDSFISMGLAVNWLKMNGNGSFKNPEKSAASARKSFLVILNSHDVKH